jgi:hypothetical protein
MLARASLSLTRGEVTQVVSAQSVLLANGYQDGGDDWN